MLDIADSHHLLPMVAGRMSFGAHSRLPSPDIAPSRGRSCSAHSLVKLPRRSSIRRRHGVAVRAAATPEGSVRPKVLSSQDNAGEDCAVFVTPDGSIQEVMCADYGFRSGFGRLYQGGDGEIPKNFFQLGWENFRKEFKQLRRSFRYNEYQEIREASPPTGFVSQLLASTNKRLVGGLASLDTKLEEAGVLPKLEAPQLPEEITDDNGDMTEDVEDVRKKLKALKLDNEPVWDRERLREKDPDRAKAPWFISAAYISLCWAMDVIYTGRPIQRFWFLETVARMPYFSYISMLHLYESLGWWRAGAELRRIHFAEEWNELHHLQIMESLGGDQFWVDRFMAQHAAVFYYWVIVGFFAFSPQTAYIFSELVEGHATDTYEEFVVENEELLKSLPPPLVALEYYKAGDLYFFDALQTTGTDPKRRPACANLYDVFRNIADDEKEHVKTMKACRDYSIVSDLAERKLASRGAVKDGGANGAAPQAVSPLPAKAGNGAGPLPIKNMDTSQLE